MLRISPGSVIAAGAVAFGLVTTIAVAQENSSSAAPTPASSTTQNDGQPAAAALQSGAQGNTNVPLSESSTTQQQLHAPVVDPQKAGSAANENAVGTPWPAPQRYEWNRGTNGNSASRPGGASLGVNVVESEDGRGVIVARIRPGTPAQQMGLQPRDRILSLNGRPVGSVDEFIAAVRGMAAGDQVQLSIDRGGGNARNIVGRLEAFRDSVAVSQGPVGNIIGRAREFVDRERTDGENLQTSYEEGSRGGARYSDFEARLARLEQRIERLTQDIQQIRNNGSSSPTGGATTQPGANTPSAINATPEQPPRLQSPTK